MRSFKTIRFEEIYFNWDWEHFLQPQVMVRILWRLWEGGETESTVVAKDSHLSAATYKKLMDWT